jgi:hypothetical protein
MSPITVQENVKAALYLDLSQGMPGTKRKLAKDAVRTDSDPNLITASKEILDSKTVREISSLQSTLRADIARLSFPAIGLKRGVYAVAPLLVERVDQLIEQAKGQMTLLVAKLEQEYPDLKQKARERLGTNYNERDYPSFEKLRGAFRIDSRYITFGTPSELEGISREIYERELAKGKAQAQEQKVMYQEAMREEFLALVSHMQERLTGVETDGKRMGKPKIFKESMVGNLENFFDVFDAKNELAQDSGLQEVVAQARALTKGLDPKKLRSDQDIRKAISEGFDKVKDQMDTMLKEKPVRKISFADDE